MTRNVEIRQLNAEVEIIIASNNESWSKPPVAKPNSTGGHLLLSLCLLADASSVPALPAIMDALQHQIGPHLRIAVTVLAVGGAGALPADARRRFPRAAFRGLRNRTLARCPPARGEQPPAPPPLNASSSSSSCFHPVVGARAGACAGAQRALDLAAALRQ